MSMSSSSASAFTIADPGFVRKLFDITLLGSQCALTKEIRPGYWIKLPNKLRPFISLLGLVLFPGNFNREAPFDPIRAQ